jgi:diguanylate cyclase (GGDEF)-like protein
LLKIHDRGEFDKSLKELVLLASIDRPLSIVIADLDHFKQVNDRFGHPTGAVVFMAVAMILKNVCEGKGDCFRYGGEELASLLPNHSISEASSVAERMCSDVHRATLDGPGRISASFGVCSLSRPTQNVEAFIRAADLALYEAKKAGRNQVRTADAAALGGIV